MEMISRAIIDAVHHLYDIEVTVRLDRPDPAFGDYATNVAMQVCKQVGKSPRDVANEIAEQLRAHDDISEVTIAGPGFINIRLSDSLLKQAMTRTPHVFDGTRYVIEYSCPNAFKELHTGHLYQTIIGDILARLVEKTGADVTRTSFGGDVGLHAAKCLWGMRHALGGEYPEKLADISTDALERAAWVTSCYVKGSAEYENDAAVKADIDELNKAIYNFHYDNDHESPLAVMYWTTRQWSYDYFDAFYDVIQVQQMDRYYPESETIAPGMAIVKEQLEKGNLKESNGAIVYEGDENKHLHTRVFVTSKGLPTYETKDIGVMQLEKQEFDFEHRILMTGNDQKEYMRVVYAAAEQFDPTLTGRMTHITNGTVKFADGKKMSSRLGNVTRALDVVEVVREKVAEMVENTDNVNAVTLGAIKYVFARYKVGGDIAFDIEETISLQGNSGPYLQYAHARACSILAKSPDGMGESQLSYDAGERALVVKLGEYTEVVEKAAREYAPHGICTYLYELAQEFNRFYEKSRIIGDEREMHRLAIVTQYRDTLADGLNLLGIEALERL